ncbi:enoyl-CoA hydratase-related protein [Acetobacteraceae bacterium KSS8]|uniref:Enoyl-CoA hydratase-related protein n=1 Tax=Endosaccharibacter trunci TaxID=2812733 RepID=A0ABT1WA10_9PROT|nr:enoyl-CoA hydratase-related protein [Acetobacteraceae bacterium KSS8]
MTKAYETILVDTDGRVGLLTLNRPDALNALNEQMLHDVLDALRGFDADEGIGCILLRGSERAFAAGADIKQMQHLSVAEMVERDWSGGWMAMGAIRTPIVAAVSGFALGGGCELAMACDILVAADTARFGQPEVKLGISPGFGGSQRLARLVGKPRAMEMCLTGRMIDAAEADRIGLVSRVVPAAELAAASLEIARTIAGMSRSATRAIKELVNRAEELSLAEGLRFERQVFHGLFSTADRAEGMSAFVEKRPARWSHR